MCLDGKNMLFTFFMILLFLLLILGCNKISLKDAELEKEMEEEMENMSIKIIEGFNNPIAINLDSENNLYVMDYRAGRIVKYNQNEWEIGGVTPVGVNIGSFNNPHSIDFDDEGNLYVTEYVSNVIKKISNKGELLGTLGVLQNRELSEGYNSEQKIGDGSLQGFMKGTATAYFDKKKDNLYVSDFGSSSILKFSKDGRFLGWIGGKQDGGVTNGWETSGSPYHKSSDLGGFHKPHSAISDLEENIYVVDTWNHRIQKFDDGGMFLGWIGGKQDGGVTNGWEKEGDSIESSQPGGFNAPILLDFDEDENFIVSEYGNHRIQKFSNNGRFLGWIGGKQEGGVTNGWEKEGNSKSGSEEGMFLNPYDAKIRKNILFVADTKNNRVQIIRIPD